MIYGDFRITLKFAMFFIQHWSLNCFSLLIFILKIKDNLSVRLEFDDFIVCFYAYMLDFCNIFFITIVAKQVYIYGA